MILVVLGTQDKPFTRLLDDVELQIKNGNIKDKVVVQAGLTDYKSEVMEIHRLIPAPEFEKLIENADLIITHGGVGTILSAIKKGKKIIACPRLSKYHEHHNDHQKQIISEFVNLGYILEYNDGDNLKKVIDKSKKFIPKKYVSNTKNMINLIEKYIDEDDNISWYNKYRRIISYLFFGGCTTVINILTYFLFRKFGIDIFISNIIAWIISVLFAFVTNKAFVFESKRNRMKDITYELFLFYICRCFTLILDMFVLFLMIKCLGCLELFAKIISNIIVIISNYILCKCLVFKKGGKKYEE